MPQIKIQDLPSLYVVRNKATKEIHITRKKKWVYFSQTSAKVSFLADSGAYLYSECRYTSWSDYEDNWEVVEIEQPTFKDTR
jgi:hypothetical protein